MSEFGAEFDFESLENEIDIDRQVRLATAMLEIDELLVALDEANKRCDDAFEQLESLLEKLEAKQGIIRTD